MIICRRCGELSKWQADKVCEACKDTREWPIDMTTRFARLDKATGHALDLIGATLDVRRETEEDLRQRISDIAGRSRR